MSGAYDRKSVMRVLAHADEAELAEGLAAAGLATELPELRPTETGLTMVRGRIGGDGRAFNLGEMTVTRCALRLADGTVGHAYVQGRDKPHAEAAALIDALMQTGAAERVRAEVLDPLAAEAARRRDTRARKAAATKVDFFTMVRGDD